MYYVTVLTTLLSEIIPVLIIPVLAIILSEILIQLTG